VPLTLLPQNSAASTFLLRLAGLAGDPSYRRWARWCLQRFPNSHREHGAYAAGFGQALARLFAPELTIVVNGTPGDSGLRSLLRAALTELRLSAPSIRFQQANGAPTMRIERDGSTLATIADASELRALADGL
jgi:uncharacterized protein YyaL (SSP411 family)